LRAGKQVDGVRYHTYVVLALGEYERMCSEWGQKFTDEAIRQYDQRYPNSEAMKKHTDHNRAIRNYVAEGYICKNVPREREKKQIDVWGEFSGDCELKCPECSKDRCEFWDKENDKPFLIGD
jgi:hypothetical protein